MNKLLIFSLIIFLAQCGEKKENAQSNPNCIYTKDFQDSSNAGDDKICFTGTKLFGIPAAGENFRGADIWLPEQYKIYETGINICCTKDSTKRFYAYGLTFDYTSDPKRTRIKFSARNFNPSQIVSDTVICNYTIYVWRKKVGIIPTNNKGIKKRKKNK